MKSLLLDSRKHAPPKPRPSLPASVDVAVVGGGMAGMATAARLQAAGLSTVVFEAHGQPGGCAGFFTRRGFSFDVGATTLVDFEAGGVGAELLETVGMGRLEGEALPGYTAWLPDRTVTLHRDRDKWSRERLRALGSSPNHRAFWGFMDELAGAFWEASRRGIRLPIRRAADLVRAASVLKMRHWPKGRFINWTMGDALRKHGLGNDRPLAALLSMLLEDTVHSSIDRAPLINGALGITIRGAGLTRAAGGMRGFWRDFVRRYKDMGGILRLASRVERIEESGPGFLLHTSRGRIRADQVVSAVPIGLTAQIAPPAVGEGLRLHLDRNDRAQGGALVVFLGVPEESITGQAFTHHQLLHDYQMPLGDGNNMFVSVSAPGDLKSAPEGHRAVILSTHCELQPWRGLTEAEYARKKREAGERLVRLARRVYPELGERARVWEVGTPRTYERFTSRPRGAVGGFRLSLENANQRAVPHETGVPGFWLVGDTTWPGLGTVACVLGSRIVAEGVRTRARRVHAG